MVMSTTFMFLASCILSSITPEICDVPCTGAESKKSQDQRFIRYNKIAFEKHKVIQADSKIERLQGDEIRNLLTGSMLKNIGDGYRREISFSEEFHVDGRWRATFYMRTINKFEGTWTVISDQICVSSLGNPDICRPVYKKTDGSEVWMPQFNFAGRTELYQLRVTKL